MSSTEQKEPTASEWAIARAVHAELASAGLTDEQRHIVRTVVIAELIKARTENDHG